LEPESRIVTLGSETLLNSYPVSDSFDTVAEAASSIPFTEEMFSALGLSVARQVSLAVRNQAKVIVLDADNTLWGGVAGEDGPEGLIMDGPWRALGHKMSEKSEQGFLLALASKNNEADLDAVFARRADDLLLSRDQFVGWKVNWKPKSENIQELAEELNLGIDSFVFIDDNPAELAEVAANCPGITAICLPAETDSIPHFIDNL
jgi:FkbH-like protein